LFAEKKVLGKKQKRAKKVSVPFLAIWADTSAGKTNLFSVFARRRQAECDVPNSGKCSQLPESNEKGSVPFLVVWADASAGKTNLFSVFAC
jgi:hypothetical protein